MSRLINGQRFYRLLSDSTGINEVQLWPVATLDKLLRCIFLTLTDFEH